MVSVDRRSVLRLLSVSGAILGASPLFGRRLSRAASNGRPRFYLHILPSGGMDPIYTLDPKRSRDVERGVDVPYSSSSIVERGAHRFGPTFKPLARWADRFAVVNMFRQNSANHQSGLAHVTRCKSNASASMPTLFDLLGARRTDEAVGAVSLGLDFSTAVSPQFLGQPGFFFYGRAPGVFDHLDNAEPDDLRTVARVLTSQADALGKRRLTQVQQMTADNLRACATLFSRAASAPKFTPVAWDHPTEGSYQNGKDLQRVLWMFENKLTRCATVSVAHMQFDTHVTNADQADLTGYLAFLVDKVFEQLDARAVDGIPLSKQTVVLVGSEIGRFPRLNSRAGKDHFPQVPYLLASPAFKPGRFGGTDRSMITLPISLETGKPQRSGHQLQIDDLGTTLLELDGASPELFGYSGARLRFLEA